MFWFQWARKELQRGDLTAQLELSNDGRWGNPNPARVERLSKRGFVEKREDERLRVTMKGRAALLLGRR